MGEGGGAEQAGQTGQHPRQSRLAAEKLGLFNECRLVDWCGTQSRSSPFEFAQRDTLSHPPSGDRGITLGRSVARETAAKRPAPRAAIPATGITGTPAGPLTGAGTQAPGEAMAEVVSGAAAVQLRGTDNAAIDAALPTAAVIAAPPAVPGTDGPADNEVPTAGPSPGIPVGTVVADAFTGFPSPTPPRTEFTADEAVRACPLIESKVSLVVDSDGDDGDASRRSAPTMADMSWDPRGNVSSPDLTAAFVVVGGGVNGVTLDAPAEAPAYTYIAALSWAHISP